MQMINYGLIVSDFDGTLVSHGGTICEKNKQAIAKYREKGGKFAISTGRMPNGILPRAQELGLKGAVSCCQGAVIVDIESKDILFQDFIPNAVAIKVCEKVEEMDLHLHAYTVWNYYCNKDDEPLQWYQNTTRTKATLVTEEKISQVLKRTGENICKFLIMLDPKDNARVMQELANEHFEGCNITKSADVLVEVVNARCSKGTAVQFLSNYYGVDIAKTLGIGDQWNDIPMVQAAGLGIAVHNADERLKEKAGFVCEHTNDEGAIAEVIDKFGFTER